MLNNILNATYKYIYNYKLNHFNLLIFKFASNIYIINLLKNINHFNGVYLIEKIINLISIIVDIKKK